MGLAAFIVNVFPSKCMQKGFCVLNITCIAKMRSDFNNNFHTSDASTKGCSEFMLKVCNFTKNKPHYRCFNKSLQKIFQTNILEDSTRQVLLIVVLMIELCSDNSLT